MLSYRHAFHAGNPADVLKHLVLNTCLSYLHRKDTPFLYIDTHAGAGSYTLDKGYAAANREWDGGIRSLLAYSQKEGLQLPEDIQKYLSQIQKFRILNGPHAYPGSPSIAEMQLRHKDKAVLFELHPTDELLLFERFSKNPQFRIFKQDGYDHLAALLPPPRRRALILLDPSFEIKDEYERALTCIQAALRRFATGVYLIWYPILGRKEDTELPEQLMKMNSFKRCRLELQLQPCTDAGRGLAGSGLVIFNPPWILKASLQESLPFLVNALGTVESNWILEWEDAT
ncbi:23S rRNA (adenine(2030)-N(6))-methyltransferase RlmJ [Treponema sp.]